MLYALTHEIQMEKDRELLDHLIQSLPGKSTKVVEFIYCIEIEWSGKQIKDYLCKNIGKKDGFSIQKIKGLKITWNI